MNFGGSTPQVVPRFGSVCSWDNPAQLPLGLARIGRNIRYTSESVATRYGYALRIVLGAAGQPVSGFAMLRYLPESTQTASTEYSRFFAYTQDGSVWHGDPFLQSSVTTPPPTPYVVAPGLSPVMTQAFNRCIAAMGNLSFGVQQPLIYDPSTQIVDGVSDQPWGFTWAPGIFVRLGQMVSPVNFAGLVYTCTAAGFTAQTEPAWPTAMGATVQDNTVSWEEYTPIAITGLPDPAACTSVSATANSSSPIVAGASVYVALTYVNAQGEGINEVVLPQGGLDPAKVFSYTNTTSGPVQLTVQTPPIPNILSGASLGAPYGATGYNLYVYIETGTANEDAFTDPSYYALLKGGVGPGQQVVISGYAVGQTLNQVNTAAVTAVDGTGAIDVGVRYMVPMFETRTEYITGWSGTAAPIRINVTASGQKLLILRAAPGPPNVTRRLFGFTVAGASAAGPYTYVDAADVESPGFNLADVEITATTIEDNATTTAILNFTDTYLPGADDVTNYADRIQVPPASDAYFAKGLGMMIYAGCVGYDFLVSDLDDPEAVRVPGSNLSVSTTDGDRAVCVRELRETPYALKENSGHAIIPNDGDPITWNVQKMWDGAGPVGPKAVDVYTDDDAAYMLFAHRTGFYRFTGATPQLVCRELIGTATNPGPWDQINWACGAQIIVRIDRKRREALICVPTGNSTVNNQCFRVNFFYGWADPVVFSVRSGKLVPNVEGRKWSLDDIAVAEAWCSPRRYSGNAAQPNIDLADEMILCGQDGGIYTLAEGQYFDQNAAGAQAGYLSQWVSVPGANPARNLFALTGATVSAIGSGNLNVYAFDQQQNTYAITKLSRPMPLAAAETVKDFSVVGTLSTAFGIGFDNGGVPGAWFEMHIATLYLLPKFTSQIG